jgi:hypothetical protein
MGEPERLYQAIDLAMIKRFAAERMVEDLHLEFKAPENVRGAEVALAKALSGFANSDGGVVVWGVHAEKVRRVEAAREPLKPINRLKAFKSRLEELTGCAVNPTVNGVLHKEVPEEGGEDQGYAVTLVPASDGTPHMAKLGEDRYYKRSGSAFLRMEHFELEDMFGRRPRPKLTLYSDVRRGSSTSGGRLRTSECNVVLGVLNEGRGVARAPYLVVRVNQPYSADLKEIHYPCPRPMHLTWPVGPHVPGEMRFVANADVVVHPQIPLEVLIVSRNVSEGEKELPDLCVEYQIFAWGARPVEGEKTLPGSDILACAIQAFV